MTGCEETSHSLEAHPTIGEPRLAVGSHIISHPQIVANLRLNLEHEESGVLYPQAPQESATETKSNTKQTSKNKAREGSALALLLRAMARTSLFSNARTRKAEVADVVSRLSYNPTRMVK